jgi:hypothetical protein
MITSDKQLYKKFNGGESGRSPHAREALSPPENGYGGYSVSPGSVGAWSAGGRSSDEDEAAGGTTSGLASPGATSSLAGSGILCDTISRKTLFYLISTLNAAFTDYDFSDAKSCEFSKEPTLQVIWLLAN